MERNAKLILGLTIATLIALAIGIYAYIQSRQYFHGPQVTITSPINGLLVTENPVTIEGIAENIAFITLNDGAIFVDKKGVFSEKLLLLPGYNILTIKAEDRFGKKTQKTLELVYKKQGEKKQASSTPLSTF
ncbi:MAG: hypothetical protein EXS59_00485 [Candidatus Taylorbacteria bacterium]|nr:hypothetical protein [Candidatus Taylorbacteria bacterium]